MMKRLFRGLFLPVLVALLTSSAPSTDAAEPDNLLSAAVTAWKSGDLAQAEDSLNQLAADSTSDPRVLYLRGIIAEQSGNDGEADLQAAARLEAEAGRSRLVNRLLESVQGPLRGKIEAERERARADIRPDPKAARHSILYADGLAALRAGNYDAALTAFDQAVAEDTQDPRIHYMRGVALARTGDEDAAKDAFRAGLAKEDSGDKVRLVSRALQSVQGDIRRMIEEEVAVAQGEATVSRQENRRIVMQREERLMQELLAADDERRAELLAQADAARRSREQQAAEEILAAEEQRAAEEAILNAPVDTTPVITEPDPMPMPADDEPAVVANPFGGSATSPVTPAEQPGTEPPSRGFFETPPSPGLSTAGETVDFTWLSPQSELLVYARPADLMNSGFMQPLMTLPPVQQALNQATGAVGFGPAQIESVTVGMSNVMAVAMQAGMQAQASGGPPDGQKIARDLMTSADAVAVIRSNVDVDFAPIVAASQGEAVEYGGTTYYRMPPEGDAPPGGMHVVDSRTVLFGSETSIKSALDRGPGSAAHPLFGFVPGNSHVSIAFASPMMSVMSGSMPTDPSAPPFVQQLTDAIRGKISGSGLILTAGNDLTVSSVMLLADEQSAQAAGNALQGAVDMGQQSFPQVRGQVPAPLQPIADQIVGSLTAASSGSQAMISATIPASLVTTLQESPEILGQLFMGAGGGFGPPNGGFGPPNGGFGPPNGGGPGSPNGGGGAPGQGSPPSFGFPPENPNDGSTTDNP